MAASSPEILRFEPRNLRPLERWERVFWLDGRAIQFVGERWREEDLAGCDYPSEPDPARPGTAIALRLISLATGRISSALAEREVLAMRASHPGPGSGELA